MFRKLFAAALLALALPTFALADVRATGNTNAAKFSQDVSLVDASTGVPVGTAAAPLPVRTDGVADGAVSTASATASGTMLSINTTGMSYLVVQFTSLGSGNSVLFEASNDGTAGTGTTFFATMYWDLSNSWQTVAFTPVTSRAYVVPVYGATTRIRVSTYSSGTITAYVLPKRGASPPISFGNVQLSSSAPANASFGQSNSDAQTAASSGTLLQTRAWGVLWNGSTGSRQYETGAAALDGTGTGVTSTEEAGRPFANITSNTTTTVKSGKGFLHTICVNTKGASANVATIYDNTAGSGTKIGTLDTTAAVGCLTYDVKFGTGLTIVTATGTAADMTVSYR